VFDVVIHPADRDASRDFYLATLTAIGAEPASDGEWDGFALAATDTPGGITRHLHVGFVAPSRIHVDAFWRAGIEAGHRDDGEPGERPQYMPGYYGAFLLDPDGNSAEAVHHDDVRGGGAVDHLWIGVRDLDRAAGFYRQIASYAGLRQGPEADTRRQFRGAWATFSLIADGRPPTEGLQLAFPAPDRRSVDEFHRTAVAAGHPGVAAPGERRARQDGYSAAVLDPDGTRVELSARSGAPAR
jgi:predicted lactoylglutathione lyase